MTEDQIRKILEEFKAGGLSSDDALHRLRALPFEDLGFANIDHHRSLRQGFPEVIFGGGKTVEQVCRIVEAMTKHDHNILVTRTTGAGSCPDCRRRHGRSTAERGWRPRSGACYCRSDQRGLWRKLQRNRCFVGNAE